MLIVLCYKRTSASVDVQYRYNVMHVLICNNIQPHKYNFFACLKASQERDDVTDAQCTARQLLFNVITAPVANSLLERVNRGHLVVIISNNTQNN